MLGISKIVSCNLRKMATYSVKESFLLEMAQSIVPPLSFDRHKGQAGRITVVGGCKEYTGAPYFAAISALKVGADLSHVFCTAGAGPVIKSYSPELIVHPVLDADDVLDEMSQWLPRMHAVVVGPGLGRDPKLLAKLTGIFRKVRELQKPLVVDADGVFFLTREPQVIQGYAKAVLTPNVVEYAELFRQVLKKKAQSMDAVEGVKELSQALGNVTIVRKGPEDIISDGNNVLVCDAEGSARRCGGQGDLLSGSMGTFIHWAHLAVENNVNNPILEEYGPNLCAAYAACLLTRDCNRRAFQSHKRSMTTTDMIACIGDSFNQLYSRLYS